MTNRREFYVSLSLDEIIECGNRDTFVRRLTEQCLLDIDTMSETPGTTTLTNLTYALSDCVANEVYVSVIADVVPGVRR
jgi:hypothetical protein